LLHQTLQQIFKPVFFYTATGLETFFSSSVASYRQGSAAGQTTLGSDNASVDSNRLPALVYALLYTAPIL